MPKKAGKYILIAVGTLCVLICAAGGVFLYQYYRGAGSEAALTQQVRPASVTPQPPQVRWRAWSTTTSPAQSTWT